MPHDTTIDREQSAANADSASGPAAETPSAAQALFASLLTPSWGLGLVIVSCLLLPCYEGCNGNAISGYQLFANVELSMSSIHATFLVGWPFVFGLLVAGGTLYLAATGNCRPLWWCLALLIGANAAFQAAGLLAVLPELHKAKGSELRGGLMVAAVLGGVTVGLLILLAVSRRYSRTPLQAAMWLQGALALAAAATFSFVIPLMIFAQGPLLGGKLGHAACLFLLLAAVVQWFDGDRALARRRGESPLQLNLKATLLLMLIGGVACAWIVLFAMAEHLA